MMFEEHEGKDVKIVFNLDAEGNPRFRRGHRGIITKVDGDFVLFVTDRGAKITLRKDAIIGIEELDNSKKVANAY